MIYARVIFTTLCRYLVNNNYNEHTGLIFFNTNVYRDDPIITIAPIRKDGKRGKAEIQFPASDIPAIIAALQQIQDTPPA